MAPAGAARPATPQAAVAAERGPGQEEGQQPDARPRVGENGGPPPGGRHQPCPLHPLHTQAFPHRDLRRRYSATQGVYLFRNTRWLFIPQHKVFFYSATQGLYLFCNTRSLFILCFFTMEQTDKDKTGKRKIFEIM